MRAPDDSVLVRGLVVEAVDAAAALIASEDVAARWDEPSALYGHDRRRAHRPPRAGRRRDARLPRPHRPHDPPDGPLLTPVTYFHAAIESPIQSASRTCRRRRPPLDRRARHPMARDSGHMRIRLAAEPEERLVAALDGRMLSLDDFCRTRLIEVLFHLDDLAASVGVPARRQVSRAARSSSTSSSASPATSTVTGRCCAPWPVRSAAPRTCFRCFDGASACHAGVRPEGQCVLTGSRCSPGRRRVLLHGVLDEGGRRTRRRSSRKGRTCSSGRQIAV